MSSHAEAVISVTVLARFGLWPSLARNISANERKSWKVVESPTKRTDLPAKAWHAGAASKGASEQADGDHEYSVRLGVTSSHRPVSHTHAHGQHPVCYAADRIFAHERAASAMCSHRRKVQVDFV